MNKSITAIVTLLGVGVGFLTGTMYGKRGMVHGLTPAQYKTRRLHQYLTTLEQNCELLLIPDTPDVVERLTAIRHRLIGIHNLSKPFFEHQSEDTLENLEILFEREEKTNRRFMREFSMDSDDMPTDEATMAWVHAMSRCKDELIEAITSELEEAA